MHIAFFTENTHAGGMDSIIVSLINNWPDASDNFTIICNQHHPGLEVIQSRLKRPCHILRHDIPLYSDLIDRLSKYKIFFWLRRFLFPLRYLLFFYYLVVLPKYLSKNRYARLMVVNGGYPAGDTCRAAVISWGILNRTSRAIFNFHNLAIEHGRWHSRLFEYMIDWLVGHYSRQLIAVSRASAESMKKRSLIWRTGKVSYIYNGIESPDNTNPDRSLSLREELGLDPESKLCLMMGTYEPRKGHDFLLRSFREVINKLPSTHLVICGYGRPREMDAVNKLVEQNELIKNVHLFGFRNDRSNILKSADVLLVPSQSFESFGLTCVEAMSYHVPVVATQVGGLPEVVIDGEGGYCLPPDDVHGFSQKIVDLLEDDSLRKDQGKLGYQRYENHFKAEIMARKYYELLESV